MCYCKPAPMPIKAGKFNIIMHSSGAGVAVIDPTATLSDC